MESRSITLPAPELVAVNTKVPDDVMGLPVTDIQDGTVIATLVTVPEPAPSCPLVPPAVTAEPLGTVAPGDAFPA